MTSLSLSLSNGDADIENRLVDMEERRRGWDEWRK